MLYEYIRKTTIRGSKVRKILKILKTYETAIDSTDEFFVSSKSENEFPYAKEIAKMSLKNCAKSIRKFIKEVFNRESYKKTDFKKKAFAGSKMVTVLNYIDVQIDHAQNNLLELNESYELFLNREITLSFNKYWEQQIESLNIIKKLIFSQYVVVQNQEDKILYSWLSEIEDDD